MSKSNNRYCNCLKRIHIPILCYIIRQDIMPVENITCVYTLFLKLVILNFTYILDQITTKTVLE